MAAEREYYNSRFQCADPMAKTAVNRSTRYRLLKKRRLEEQRRDEDFTDNLYVDPEFDNTDLSETGIEPTGSEFVSDDADSSNEVVTEEQSPDVLAECELLNDFYPPDLLIDEQVLHLSPDLDSDEDSNEREREIINDQSEQVDDVDGSNFHNLPDVSLFDGCPLTLSASNLLIMKFKMRHNITKEALSDLLKLIKLHCPIPNLCPSSLYLFEKHFKTLKYPVRFHLFCDICYEEIQPTDTECPNLACKIDLNDQTRSSFIELPLKEQLTSILESKYAV